MKRTEILTHIKEDLLEKLMSAKLSINNELWAEWVANELLDMIEGFGMKPPQLPGIDSYSLTMGGDYNRWEEE